MFINKAKLCFMIIMVLGSYLHDFTMDYKYLCDNNIHSFAQRNVDQMKKIGAHTNNPKIIVLIDLSFKENNKQIALYYASPFQQLLLQTIIPKNKLTNNHRF